MALIRSLMGDLFKSIIPEADIPVITLLIPIAWSEWVNIRFEIARLLFSFYVQRNDRVFAHLWRCSIGFDTYQEAHVVSFFS